MHELRDALIARTPGGRVAARVVLDAMRAAVPAVVGADGVRDRPATRAARLAHLEALGLNAVDAEAYLVWAGWVDGTGGTVAERDRLRDLLGEGDDTWHERNDLMSAVFRALLRASTATPLHNARTLLKRVQGNVEDILQQLDAYFRRELLPARDSDEVLAKINADSRNDSAST